jgi:hypothetical protein
VYKVCGLQIHDPVMPRPAADAGAGILYPSARERHFCDFNALPQRTYKPLRAIMAVLNQKKPTCTGSIIFYPSKSNFD